MGLAKVYTIGGQQIVKLPEEYRINDDEVFINRAGDAIILTPISTAKDLFRKGINGFSSDFLSEGRPKQSFTDRESM